MEFNVEVVFKTECGRSTRMFYGVIASSPSEAVAKAEGWMRIRKGVVSVDGGSAFKS